MTHAIVALSFKDWTYDVSSWGIFYDNLNMEESIGALFLDDSTKMDSCNTTVLS